MGDERVLCAERLDIEGLKLPRLLARMLALWYTPTMAEKLRRIGLVAVRQEILPLLDWLAEGERVRWGETVLREGLIAGRTVALAEVLPGPVNAAVGTQALVAKYGVSALISFGSAGALVPNLAPGDLVIARRAVAHDAGYFLAQRYEPSGVLGYDRRGRVGYRRGFDADPDLVSLARGATQSIGGRLYTGTVVTGNQVVLSSARARWLRQTFGALVVEMETAAVAQVAVAHRLPWVAIRAVSDDAGEDLILDLARLRPNLEDGRPTWRLGIVRWSYLLGHPKILRRLLRLQRGLDLAGRRSAQAVHVMLQRAEHWAGGRSQDRPSG